jgi:hypothetical protein
VIARALKRALMWPGLRGGGVERRARAQAEGALLLLLLLLRDRAMHQQRRPVGWRNSANRPVRADSRGKCMKKKRKKKERKIENLESATLNACCACAASELKSLESGAQSP